MQQPEGGPGLRLSPFRGLRFAVQGQDLSDLLCPPYDVVEPDRRAALLDRSPHNVVRLTLPEARNARAAAETLGRWVAAGVLAVDDDPSLYVLEQCRGGRRWLGVVAAVDIDREAVLPHEDVMPGPVADRAALLEEAATDLEPILLTVDGDLGAALVPLATGRPVATGGVAGVEVRLWQVTDGEATAHLQSAVRDRVALIADGHHRWTAAGRHRDHMRATAGPGPWDRCLALVVDSSTDPLDLAAIHRVLGGRSADDLRRAWAGAATWMSAPPDAECLADLVERAGAGVVAMTDGRTGWFGRRDDAATLDVEWLHEVLPLAGVSDDDVSYHHDVQDLAYRATRAGGAAVLLSPVDLHTVRARSASGRMMPRKATSFSPKPPSGLVMRRHEDG